MEIFPGDINSRTFHMCNDTLSQEGSRSRQEYPGHIPVQVLLRSEGESAVLCPLR